MQRFPEKILASSDIYAGGRKRIFIGLLAVSCVAICLCLLLVFVLPWLGPQSTIFRYVSIAVACAGIFLLSWLCVILIYHIHTKRQIPGISSIRNLLIRLFLPLMEIAGRFFGIDRRIVRRSFIKVNNELILAKSTPVSPDKLLLLLPHCIQASKCSRRLSYSIENCRHCGECQIGSLLDLSHKYGIQMAVATGGTIARRIVVNCAPKLIIAVACERDLASGIQDCYPIPVFGLLNERPHGPCMDTRVPMEVLMACLWHFLKPEPDRNKKPIAPKSE